MILRLIGAGLPTWVAAIQGDLPVWQDFLAGYAAGVDTPFSACWRDLATTYPDADPMVPLFRVMFDDVFTDSDNPADVMAGYERRLAQVRAEIEPERLVEWQPGDRWKPIASPGTVEQ